MLNNEEGRAVCWPFKAIGESAPSEARGRLTVDEPAIARAAVLDGAGVGYFIEKDVAEDIAAGRRIRLPEDWTPPRPGFSVYYPGRRNPSAGFAAFFAIVRESAAPVDRRQGMAGSAEQL